MVEQCMQSPPLSPATMSDADLIAELGHLVARERWATGQVLRSLMEFDARRLYLALGYSSMFAYCTQALHYAEHAALNRIEVARAARRLPCLLGHIDAGMLNITGARLLVPHLTPENVDRLLAAATHKSKREIEEMVATLQPKPGVPSIIRRLTPPKEAAPAGTVSEPPPDAIGAAAPQSQPTTVTPPVTSHRTLVPFSSEHYKVQFTITRETRDRLRQVQDLMRHVNPNGDPAVIFDRGLTLLLEDLQRSRYAATSRPRAPRRDRAKGRHIPADVRRAVWLRDAGRCAFVGASAVCGERGFLEFHHVVPFAAGGPATVANIQLRCRAHNAYEAALFFAMDDSDLVRERRAPYAALSRGSQLRTALGVSSRG